MCKRGEATRNILSSWKRIHTKPEPQSFKTWRNSVTTCWVTERVAGSSLCRFTKRGSKSHSIFFFYVKKADQEINNKGTHWPNKLHPICFNTLLLGNKKKIVLSLVRHAATHFTTFWSLTLRLFIINNHIMYRKLIAIKGCIGLQCLCLRHLSHERLPNSQEENLQVWTFILTTDTAGAKRPGRIQTKSGILWL